MAAAGHDGAARTIHHDQHLVIEGGEPVFTHSSSLNANCWRASVTSSAELKCFVRMSASWLPVGEYLTCNSPAAKWLRMAAASELAVQGEVFDEDFFLYHEDTDLAWRAALFGWLFFAETVTPTVLAGTALIVIGCAIATRRDSRAGST